MIFLTIHSYIQINNIATQCLHNKWEEIIFRVVGVLLSHGEVLKRDSNKFGGIFFSHYT